MSADKTTYSMILCSLMSRYCDERGMLQKEFFKEAGIAAGSWSRIMRGQAHLQIEDIRSACHVLGSSVGELTKEADELQDKLARKEGIEVVSKAGLKSGGLAGVLIAGAALGFLLMRLKR